MSDDFELGEEDEMSLRQAWPFQRHYVKSGTRITEQSICVYKAYAHVIFLNDRWFV